MYPATQNTGTLTGLIQKIGTHGVPSKFTTKDLPAWGYKSSHDRPVVGILRFIGFLDNSGVPTELWREARTNAPGAVAKGVRAGYAELFSMFPDANRKDAESLTNFFKAKTSVSEAGVKQIVGTFKALSQIGDFDSASDPESPPPSPSATMESSSTVPLPKTQIGNAGGLGVTLNIELSIPADPTGEVYDKFFAAMRKHLFDGGG